MTRHEGQMRLLKEARSVGDPKDLLTLVDMAGVLADAGFPPEVVAQALDLPVQGSLTRLERLREAQDIVAAWPDEDLLLARRHGADWHALREPARWWRTGAVEREEVVGFVRPFVARTRRWPTTDELRRRFGYAPGHRSAGDAPGQESIPLGAA